MQQFDYIIILLFSLGILGAGMSFAKTGKNMKSFFAAGEVVPWQVSGLSLFMSFFSAGTFVVWGSIAYDQGLVSVTIQTTMFIGGIVTAFFIAPAWKKTGILTASQFIKERLSKSVQKYFTYIFLVLSLFSTGAVIYAVGKLINVSTGFSIQMAVLAIGMLIILYTAVGGLWAVMVTDVLQFVILTSAVLIVLPLAFGSIGGVEGLLNKLPDDHFNLTAGEYTWEFVVAYAFYHIFYIGGNWTFIQRFTSVPKPSSAKKVGLLFGILYLLFPLIWMLPPMIYRVMNADLAGLENEGAYLLVCKRVLPAGMLGLMLAGMIFATASTANTNINLSAAVLTNDVFKQLFGKYSEKKLMVAARLLTVIFGGLTMGVALLVPKAGGVVEFVISMGAITGGALFLPPIWALFSKRQNGFSVFISSAMSLLVNLIFKFVAPFSINIQLNRAEEMLLGVIMPMFFLLIFEIIFGIQKKTDPNHFAFQQLVKSRKNDIVKSDEETTFGKNQHNFGLRVIGVSLVFTSLLFFLIAFLTATRVLLVASFGTVIAVTGVVIFRLTYISR